MYKELKKFYNTYYNSMQMNNGIIRNVLQGLKALGVDLK